MRSQCRRLPVARWCACDPCRVLELFSDRARQVVVEASETARALGHGFIGAEHLLLGVIAEKHGVGARVLESLGVSDEAVRGELLLRHPQGDRPSEGALPFNEEGRSVLERSLVEAKNLGDSRIQTEHMLLALLSTEPRSAAESARISRRPGQSRAARGAARRDGAPRVDGRGEQADVRRVGEARSDGRAAQRADRCGGVGGRVRSLAHRADGRGVRDLRGPQRDAAAGRARGADRASARAARAPSLRRARPPRSATPTDRSRPSVPRRG